MKSNVKKQSTPDDLEASRDQRVRRRAADRIESSVTYLRFARSLRAANGQECERLDALIKSSEDELTTLRAELGGTLMPRLRPNPERRSAEKYLLFVDECGNHALNAKETFSTFCLSGVLVSESAHARFDELWRAWKTTWLGSAEKIVHEPDVRKGERSFWFDGDAERRAAAYAALDGALASLPYMGFACVLHRDDYVAQHGKASLDSSLPQHPYLMTVNFLAERVALALENELGGATARWIIESRGVREDAAFQFEFARLFLDGTTYLTPHYFRHVFKPGLEFHDKKANTSGLQIADLQARPCAEKVQDPSSAPPRWHAVRRNLCRGEYTGHSILGFKVMPWDVRFERLWDS